MLSAPAWVLVVSLSSPGATPVEEAALLEEQAFAAADEKRYCDALALFLRADALASNPDLLFNAAQVAAAGGDWQRALIIYAGLLDDYPGAKQRAEVRREMDTLSARIEREGPGKRCKADAPAEPAAAAPAAPVAPAAEPVPPAAPAPATPPADAPGLPLDPWTVVVGGGVGVGVGGLLLLVGSAPFLEYNGLVDGIRAAESEGNLAEATALQAQLAPAAESWTSWGQAVVVGGAVLATLGAVAAGGGAVWFATSPSPSEGAQ